MGLFNCDVVYLCDVQAFSKTSLAGDVQFLHNSGCHVSQAHNVAFECHDSDVKWFKFLWL